MRSKAYNPEQAAARIAGGHSFKKHVLERNDKTEWKEWHRLGVRNEEDYKRHISEIIKSKDTRVYQSVNKKDIYYHAKTKTFISVDLRTKDGGTCFLCPVKDLREELDREVKERRRLKSLSGKSHTKLSAKPVFKRGHGDLYKNKKINKQLVTKLERKVATKQFKNKPVDEKSFTKFRRKEEVIQKRAARVVQRQALTEGKVNAKKVEIRPEAKNIDSKRVADLKNALEQKKAQEARLMKTRLDKQQNEAKRANEKARQEQIKREQLEVERKRQLEEARKKALQEAKESQLRRERELDKNKRL